MPAGGEVESLVEEGKPAPDFELTSDAGESVSLASLRGTPVVLYFLSPGRNARLHACVGDRQEARPRAGRPVRVRGEAVGSPTQCG